METLLETKAHEMVELGAGEGSSMPLKFRFDPFSGNGRKVLGSLEVAIMGVVWRQAPTTVGQVHRALLESRDLAYTTIMTTMNRLADKGWLDRDRSGVTHTYTPVLSKTEFERYVVATVAGALMDEYGALLHEFVLGGADN